MALDLSALEEKPSTPATADAGKPLDILLSDIEEDPDQPRKEFTPEAMQEMTESIRARGVKTPVSVRTHPSKPGKWMLNHGARRYRGSAAAGHTTIPSFIDEAHDDYDQVIENIQRDDLKPMELAIFIKGKLDGGVKKNEIARRLGKSATSITELMALVDAPACVEAVYTSGRCSSPKTLYELRMLAEKYPEQVQEWCENAEDVTRKSVTELSDILKSKQNATVNAEKLRHDKVSSNPGSGETPEENQNRESGDDSGSDSDNEQSEGPSRLPFHNPDIEKNTKEPTITDPNKIKKPLLLVEFEGREAMVLLNRRPTTSGLVYIRFEDGSGEQEVPAVDCKMNLLTESEK